MPFVFIFSVIGLSITLTGCSNGEVTLSTVLTPTAYIEEATPTDPEPTITLNPTPTEELGTQVPLAARVNGEGISLEEYKAELTRFQMTLGTGLATYSEESVLEDLIDQVLLVQAANELGYLVDEALLDTRIRELNLSDQALEAWMVEYGYSKEDFRQIMKRAIAAAWMRDQLIAEVPEIAEQVHARQILLYNSIEAESVYAQLEGGTEFGTLAAQYEPVSYGDLGWFPRGYLNVSDLDDVLFNLEPGTYSAVIQSSLGYHIVQVLERDPNHPLTADARRVIQVQVLAKWLESRRNQSDIIILLP